MTPGYTEFEFNLPEALLTSLIVVLDGMETGVLNSVTASAVPEAQGIYQLFHEGNLVYIGKTDGQAGLRVRLARHASKLLHRPALATGSVTFKAVRIMVFTAMDLETNLIRHYGPLNPSGKVPWNGSGFGSNDPGRQRETTNKAPEGFDAQFPISIDIPGKYVPRGEFVVAQVLARLKAALPYTFRYETLRSALGHAQRGQPHKDLETSKVHLPEDCALTVRQILQLVLMVLPGWQATQFVSHVIFYKELHHYTHGTVIIPISGLSTNS